MSQAQTFCNIMKNGKRKKMQREKLIPFLKSKHVSTQASLKLVVSHAWDLKPWLEPLKDWNRPC